MIALFEILPLCKKKMLEFLLTGIQFRGNFVNLIKNLSLLELKWYCFISTTIVPGTGGNQLEAKLVGKPSKPALYCHSTTSSYFTLWLDIKSLLPFSINCWVDNIR